MKREPQVRSDFLKCIYSGMLEELPAADVVGFWKNRPLHMGGRTYTGREFFSFVWQRRCFVPSRYCMEVMCALEPFFVSRGLDIRAFVDRTLRANRGTFFSAGAALFALERVLKQFFRLRSVHVFLVKHIHTMNGALAPGALLRSVRERKTAAGDVEVLWLMSFDPTFSFGLPPVDVELFKMPCVCLAPLRLGGEPFQPGAILSSTLSATEHAGGTAVVENGRLRINGDLHGTVVSYHEWLRGTAGTVPFVTLPDAQGVLVDRDYYCPLRKRTVLHAGCLYGAPVDLFTTTYRPTRHGPASIVTSIAHDLLGGDGDGSNRAAQAHAALLASLRPVSHVRFCRDRDSLWIDNRYITSGPQARILRKMLAAYVRENRTLFHRREFTEDPHIGLDPLSGAFDTRLKRIAGALAKNVPHIRVAHHGRGSFRLHTDAEIELIDS